MAGPVAHGDGGPVRPTTPIPVEEIPAHVRSQLSALEIAVLPNRRRWFRFAKRAIDLAIALPVLVVTAPVIAAIGVVIRRESPGPAIFRQPRVGRDGEVFTFYKFRTMYTDARERFPELYDYTFDSSELSSRYYKRCDDPRNTPFGAAIRRTTLDELPNLFNVVKGDASIVGPRPELPDMIHHYEPSQLVKFAVKPGLTGLAACTGRNTLTIDEQIRADVEYVAGQNLRFDLWIIGRTIRMIPTAMGAE
jgi:lipopolysaccharide/colanic/teichoic acid biosynthesis glycosyltransferase